MRLSGFLVLGAVLVAGMEGSRCKADVLTFTATLAGANEVPANACSGTGFATVVLNGNMLTVTESFSDLSAKAVAAHIHCCAPIGTNAPVVVPFADFPKETSGMYSHTFDLSSFSFGGGLTEETFLAGLESDQAYVNIHDANFPGGEIEGHLMVTTPEPSSLLLLGTGLLSAVGLYRRRQAAESCGPA